MQRNILLSVLAVLFIFALPALLSAAPVHRAEETATPETAPLSAEERFRVSGADDNMVLTVRTDQGDVSMTMAEYLPQALAAEMPAAFEREALKAQAVALRSYVFYHQAHPKDNHPDADVCTAPGCCTAFADTETLKSRWGGNYDAYLEKLTSAVRDTDGEYLVWEASPAMAVFHASSYGNTESGAALGLSAPYLVSVETPETGVAVNALTTTVEVSAADFQATIQSAFPAAALEKAPPASWVGAVTLNAAGRVAEANIGGVQISGLALRQLFALRSTDFTLAWDGEKQSFIFRVNGYGHGLGMSQYGANLMAKAGGDYVEILAHYYPGTELAEAT